MHTLVVLVISQCIINELSFWGQKALTTCVKAYVAPLQVLYLDIASDQELQRLQRMADLAKDILRESGLLEDPDSDKANSSFTPHVTIAKLSQMARKKGGRKWGRGKLPWKLPPVGSSTDLCFTSAESFNQPQCSSNCRSCRFSYQFFLPP